MRKKYQLLLLIALPIVIGLACCDFKSEEEKREEAISFFIMEMSDDYTTYRSKNFKKIDSEFLQGQTSISDPFQSIVDTTQQKINLLKLAGLSTESDKTLNQKLKSPSIDQVDEILIQNARLDRILSSGSDELFDALEAIKQEQQRSTTILNQALQQYNFSIYGLDLSEKISSSYYHKFILDGVEMEGIFELNTEDFNIISFKII